MCIGIWTLDHPHYALILGTNRDEFLHRPTQNAHFHAFGVDGAPPNVLAGRDEQGGGSWFGINRAGRVALLTNITEPPKKYDTSRGSLVSSFLLSESTRPLLQPVDNEAKSDAHEGADDGDADEAIQPQQQQDKRDPYQLLWEIIPRDAKFAGFNLLLLEPSVEEAKEEASKAKEGEEVVQGDGSRRRVHYRPLFVTNHGGGGQVVARGLTPNEQACGGMSNGVDGQGAELWPKVQHATHDFDSALHRIQRLVQVQVQSRALQEPEAGDLSPRTRTAAEIEVSPTDEPTSDAETEAELVDAVFNLLSWHSPKRISTRAELRETVQVLPVRLSLGPVTSDSSGTPPPPPHPTPEPTSSSSPTSHPTTPHPLPAAPPAAPPPPLPAGTEPSNKTPTEKGHGNTPPPVLPNTTSNISGNDPSITTPKPSSTIQTSSGATVPRPNPTETPAYYATRLSTVVLVTRQGQVTFVERDIWELPLESDESGKGDGHGAMAGAGEGGDATPAVSATAGVGGRSPVEQRATSDTSQVDDVKKLSVEANRALSSTNNDASDSDSDPGQPQQVQSRTGDDNDDHNELTTRRAEATRAKKTDLDSGVFKPYRSDPPRERKFRFNLDLDGWRST